MKLSEQVVGVLDGAEKGGDGLSLKIVQQLDRPLYEEVNKALLALGGKWNRTARAHVFERPFEDALAQAVLTGEVESVQKTFDYYQTPRGYASDLVLRLMNGMREVFGSGFTVDIGRRGVSYLDLPVLEPSVGGGRILSQLIDSQFRDITVMDIRKEAYEDALYRYGLQGVEVLQGDFLDYQPGHEGFAGIVMNPPFSRSQDAEHILHAYEVLRPGGVLVSVASAGVLFRESRAYRQVRELAGSLERSEVSKNQPGTFHDEGTNVNTATVVLRKPR